MKPIMSFNLKYSARWVAQVVSKPLTQRMNQYFQEGTFPQTLKFSFVKPIPKNSNKIGLNNLTKVSFTQLFSKVFEKVMCTRLCDFY